MTLSTNVPCVIGVYRLCVFIQEISESFTVFYTQRNHPAPYKSKERRSLLRAASTMEELQVLSAIVSEHKLGEAAKHHSNQGNQVLPSVKEGVIWAGDVGVRS